MLSSACSHDVKVEARLTLKACRLPGLSSEARCGNFEVPENRSLKKGRVLSLYFAVIPAVAKPAKEDPLFILVGGPGQAATLSGVPVVEALAKVGRYRDIVLLDQRGTGKSHPLACKREGAASLSEIFAPKQDPEDTKRCLEALDADTTQYSTQEAVNDLDALRAALGYKQINLWGASYGTRVALFYLRQFGEHARSVVLDGVAPTQLKLPLHAGEDAAAALSLAFDACERSPDCNRTFPNSRTTFSELLASLRPAPPLIQLPHPRTGEVTELRVTERGFLTALRSLLYVPRLVSLIPLIVRQAAAGDFSPLAAATDAMAGGVEEGLAEGMFLSVLCAEDLARIEPHERAKAVAASVFGDAMLEPMERACALWPHAKLDSPIFERVVSDRPVLLLSGEIDPVTPPRWAAEAARGLSNARGLVAHGVGHGVSMQGCAPDLIAQFIEDPEPQQLDASCLETLARPPFVLNYAGTAP